MPLRAAKLVSANLQLPLLRTGSGTARTSPGLLETRATICSIEVSMRATERLEPEVRHGTNRQWLTLPVSRRPNSHPIYLQPAYRTSYPPHPPPDAAEFLVYC
ncbi:hypothetical protein OH76DRAFT_631181 [Lentinus brumalis]|uniref:Uncharacterized protein n=1 Tax=Lentinus brumalis TaxID=2498619 RepID=A0A371D8I0_9APHY|nr:hypothetical protein OH76DRAFT_631181 [Polyporus brumalis]